MQITQILIEHVVNLHTDEMKQKYADEVWNILQASYAPMGGFKTASSIDSLIRKSGMWKLITRNGRISAIKIYRDQFGKKSIGVATDGTSQGKRDLRMILADDIKYGRCWAEVSGPPERIMKNMGARPIPNIYAEYLTRHTVTEYNPDGYHYTKMIEGEPHEKIMFGTLELSPEDQENLAEIGVNFKTWPTKMEEIG